MENTVEQATQKPQSAVYAEQIKENSGLGKVFRIGIAMAGAVSAGAYTGGVMDYLLETLEKWEKAKEKNLKILYKWEMGEELEEGEEYDFSIPMHNVVIEVMGGASAGGMTSAITTLSMYDEMEPVTKSPEEPSQVKNKLFTSWVNLNDGNKAFEEHLTFKQMLNSNDITGYDIPSLLNSSPIDAIADNAKEFDTIRRPDNEKWPSYLSRDLELILTICSLRGIPIEINFGTSQDPEEEDQEQKSAAPAHKMYLHKGTMHFTVNLTRAEEKDHLLPIDPEDDFSKTIVTEGAKATGAFPIGLEARYFDQVPNSYLKAQIKRIFGNEELNINWARIPENFNFTAVDGGTVNNEPFEEVLQVLEERFQEDELQQTDEERSRPSSDFRNYAILMIDPFPNFDTGESDQTYDHPTSIQQIVPEILFAVRRQAMIKEQELSRGFTNDHTRAMIFPVRRDKDPQTGKEKKVDFAIACGSLDGFGGFFSRDFREHDFFLGRKNCQSFLRKHFSLWEKDAFVYESEMIDMGEGSDPIQKFNRVGIRSDIFTGWEPESEVYKRFAYQKGDKVVFPIIPDMSIVDTNSKDPEQNGSLPSPQLKRLKGADLKTLKKPISRRVGKILWTMLMSSISSLFSSEKTPESKRAARFVDSHISTAPIIRNFISFLFIVLLFVLSPILIVVGYIAYRRTVASITRSIFKAIVMDFQKRDLLL